MFLCNSWYLKRQHKKKQNANATASLNGHSEPWPTKKARFQPRLRAIQKAALQMQQSEMAVAQSESAWKSILRKGLPETPSTSRTPSCYSMYAETPKQDQKQGEKSAEIDEHTRLVTTNQNQLPPRDFLLIKELRQRRRLSDLTYDRPHLPNWKSARQEKTDMVQLKQLFPSTPNLRSWFCPVQATTSVQAPVTEPIASVEQEPKPAPVSDVERLKTPTELTMPAWYQDMREQSFLRVSRRKKESTHNWASAQIAQMHYEIRELSGKKFQKNLCDCAVFDWPE